MKWHVNVCEQYNYLQNIFNQWMEESMWQSKQYIDLFDDLLVLHKTMLMK